MKKNLLTIGFLYSSTLFTMQNIDLVAYDDKEVKNYIKPWISMSHTEASRQFKYDFNKALTIYNNTKTTIQSLPKENQKTLKTFTDNLATLLATAKFQIDGYTQAIGQNDKTIDDLYKYLRTLWETINNKLESINNILKKLSQDGSQTTLNRRLIEENSKTIATFLQDQQIKREELTGEEMLAFNDIKKKFESEKAAIKEKESDNDFDKFLQEKRDDQFISEQNNALASEQNTRNSLTEQEIGEMQNLMKQMQISEQQIDGRKKTTDEQEASFQEILKHFDRTKPKTITPEKKPIDVTPKIIAPAPAFAPASAKISQDYPVIQVTRVTMLTQENARPLLKEIIRLYEELNKIHISLNYR